MRSAQVSKTLSRAAPRRSERLRQRRIAKLSESTTAVTGSKRSYVDEDTGVTFSVKRIKLIVKEEVTVDATVEAPDVVLEETVVLPILTDAAESKNSELEISVDGDETAADVMDVDPHPLPVFSRLVYSPSPLAMSVVLDEALEPRYTAVLSTNACRAGLYPNVFTPFQSMSLFLDMSQNQVLTRDTRRASVGFGRRTIQWS
ncbi:hypothetical protein BJ741DRAFT_84269 [Chytriomyces cf. hyalinus JEL632]|nr:hypothetical protein BJ741DRAFT_84269 [Chytriomyces cf. hyalinus JEL632]